MHHLESAGLQSSIEVLNLRRPHRCDWIPIIGNASNRRSGLRTGCHAASDDMHHIGRFCDVASRLEGDAEYPTDPKQKEKLKKAIKSYLLFSVLVLIKFFRKVPLVIMTIRSCHILKMHRAG